MGILARTDKLLTLIYSSNTRKGIHTLSYLTAIDKEYLAIDIAKTKLPGMLWIEIAQDLGVKVGDLIEKRELNIASQDTSGFGTEDWIKILRKNDFALASPIAINGKRIKQITNPVEILEFFGVDSAGLEQSPIQGKKIDHERTTGDETFIPKNPRRNK